MRVIKKLVKANRRINSMRDNWTKNWWKHRRLTTPRKKKLIEIQRGKPMIVNAKSQLEIDDDSGHFTWLSSNGTSISSNNSREDNQQPQGERESSYQERKNEKRECVFRAPWPSKFNVHRLILRAHQQLSWALDWAWLTLSAKSFLPFFCLFKFCLNLHHGRDK